MCYLRSASWLLFFLILTLSSSAWSQNNLLDFEHITIKDGLPENSVTAIIQDNYGFLWFGTYNGLARYDGYSLKLYQIDSDLPRINALLEDYEGKIWAAYGNMVESDLFSTEGGLSVYDRNNKSFLTYKNDPADESSLSSNIINCLYEDSSKRLWVGTGRGLNLFDRVTGKFKKFYINKDEHAGNINTINCIIQNPVTKDLLIGTKDSGLWIFNIRMWKFEKYSPKGESTLNDFVSSFYCSRTGLIYIGYRTGIAQLDPEKNELRYINFFERIFLDYPFFQNITEDNQNLIWFSSWGNGLFSFDPANGNIQNYRLDWNNRSSISSNSLMTIYHDRTGIIWIGTLGSGLNKLDLSKALFQKYKHDPYNVNSLSDRRVRSVYMDSLGILWAGTHTALDQVDVKNSIVKHYRFKEKDITSRDIYSIHQDKEGNLWLAVEMIGLVKFSPKTGKYKTFDYDPEDPGSISKEMISIICEDYEGNIWIGTDGDGLNKYDRAKDKFIRYSHDPNDFNSLSNNRITALFVDHNDILWVGTLRGSLNRFNKTKNNFTRFNTSEFLGIADICEDLHHNLWVGSFYEGLSLFDREKGSFTREYRIENGLVNDAVRLLINDNSGNIWVGTENGLSKFNPATESFKTYTTDDGLCDNRFFWNCAYKTVSGHLILGTYEGLIIFDPSKIEDDPIPPEVSITDISLFNRPDDKLNLDTFVPDIRELYLSHDQNDLRFDYSAMHFHNPERNQYKYKMEGYNHEWIAAGNNRNATYTNLDPGEYTFRVIAANCDGIWNTKAAFVKIFILPPWWTTYWAYFGYFFLLSSIFYIAWKLQIGRIRLKHEYEMSKFEAEKMHEVDQLKTKFFTNISHEFRTPLTLILGPVKQLLDKINEQAVSEQLKLIQRSAKKLNRLVDELLDISRIEAGEMKLKTYLINIVEFIRDSFLAFQPLAERKKICFNFSSSANEILVYIDKSKTDQIINNILSNAFKFTPEGGNIDLEIKYSAKDVSIIISDSGIGIHGSQIDKIFDRFYQVDSSHTRSHEGTGIGLALTKELVELHRGKINVISEEGRGSMFTVTFLLGKKHLKPEEICLDASSAITDKPSTAEFDDTTFINLMTDSNETKAGSLPRLLIVEDNSDVRQFVSSILNSDYNILTAVNGEEAFEKSIKLIPDLIISDIMMPVMDGYQLCRKLKTDERTSHIPIILLTARATSNDKIEGFKTGADEYIMKPFEPAELTARIKNLLQQRKRLHNHFRMYGLTAIDEKNITSLDQKFLQKAFEIINEHLADTSFSVEIFASSMSVSRSLLFKKTRALTGDSPSDLIRRIRLNKAAVLIEKKSGNISEIALDVGFSNPSYFAECFHKQFGISPSHFTKNN